MAALDPTRSINGGQTRPLSPHALAELADIATAPRPRTSVNPGVCDRLTREPEPLCVLVDLPSPFKAHHGRGKSGLCPHLQATEAGRKALQEPSCSA